MPCQSGYYDSNIKGKFIVAKGVKKLIIITGKGIHSKNEKNPYISKNLGKLKYSVPDFLKKNKELMGKISSINDAELVNGGEGAFYIYLKKKL